MVTLLPITEKSIQFDASMKLSTLIQQFPQYLEPLQPVFFFYFILLNQ